MRQHGCHGRRGRGQGEQLQKLVADPLPAQGHQVVRPRRTGGQAFGVERGRKAGGEAEEAQDPEVILGDPFQGRADEAHAARLQVLDAAEEIQHLARARVGVERVDREIPSPRILLPVVGEGDLGVAPEGCDIPPERRHLMRHPARHRRHRTMLQARRHGANAGPLQRRNHRLGLQPCSEIDVGHRQPQQPVAHGTAHEPGRPAIGIECGQQLCEARLVRPQRRVQPHQRNLADRFTSIPAVAPQIVRSCHSIT